MKYQYTYQQMLAIHTSSKSLYESARGLMAATQSSIFKIVAKLHPSVVTIPPRVRAGEHCDSIAEDFELPTGMSITSSLDSLLLTQKNPYVILGNIPGEERLVVYLNVNLEELESKTLKDILTKLHARQLYAATLTAQLVGVVEDSNMSHLNGNEHFIPHMLEIDADVVKNVCKVSNAYYNLIADSSIDDIIVEFMSE